MRIEYECSRGALCVMLRFTCGGVCVYGNICACIYGEEGENCKQEMVIVVGVFF